MSEITKFDGDLFWDQADTESSIERPDDALDNVGVGDIIEFEHAKRLANFFGVLCENDCRYFTTLEEAETCSEEVAKRVAEDGKEPKK